MAERKGSRPSKRGKSRNPASGIAARGYTWAPFHEGNLAALRHGAYSPRIVAPLADELARWLLQQRADLEEFAFSVSAWARAETLCAILVHAIGDPVDERGEPRERLLKEWRAAERRAAEERIRLGLDPTAAARLTRERADAVRGVIDLEAIRERGRAALKARGLLRGGEDAS